MDEILEGEEEEVSSDDVAGGAARGRRASAALQSPVTSAVGFFQGLKGKMQGKQLAAQADVPAAATQV